MTENNNSAKGPKIVVRPHGPYWVYGYVPLVAKTQLVTEFGEPVAWRKDRVIDTAGHLKPDGHYSLCRCGCSKDKPFCDSTHKTIAFDGTESADSRPTAQRQAAYDGEGPVVVRHDDSLCANSGFCSMRLAHISDLARQAGRPGVPAQIIAMVEHCPSGSLSYALAPDPAAVEPDLPLQIAATTEITSAGPIVGPLWVTGGIPIERADGQPVEPRNRVTLCCCGESKNKPFCDGTHRPPDKA